MSCSLVKVLGSRFQRGRGADAEIIQLSSEQLAGSAVIGLYFSNAESSKSKEFTERLIQFQEQMNKDSEPPAAPTSSSSTSAPTQAPTFQIFMICFDETERIVYVPETSTPFLTFTGEGARVRQEHLIRKYGVQETPSLILIDGSSGSIINFCGREKLTEDPQGIQFPWRHPTCLAILSSGPLITSAKSADAAAPASADGNVFQASTVEKNAIKGLFFAAHWCPPCRTFLTTLTQAYQKLKERKKNFEIIFVSSDRSLESFDRFFSQMPWQAIPYADEKRRKDLTAVLNVRAIPTLVLLDEDNKVITSDGRTEINEDLEALDFPWYPKAVEELRDKHSSVLNHTLCLIYFLGDDESEYDKAESILSPIATEITESDMEEAFQPKFFIATDSELSESLRLFTDMEENKSYVLILDIPNFRYVVSSTAQLTDEKSIRDYFKDFQQAKLQYKYIQSRFI